MRLIPCTILITILMRSMNLHYAGFKTKNTEMKLARYSNVLTISFKLSFTFNFEFCKPM